MAFRVQFVICWCCGLAVLWPPLTSRAQTAHLLHGDTVVRFASVAEGRRALSRSDRFTGALSRFDLESRLKSKDAVSVERFLAFAADQVRPWDAPQVERLSPILELVRGHLTGFELAFPDTVLLVQTTGREEGQAAYCRGNAIVLPRAMLAASTARLTELLIHELYHVLSSHNPTLRHTMYEIIGFQPCAPIQIPPALAERKITNPDAPIVDCFTTVEHHGRTLHVVPMLYASDDYDLKRGGSFFRYVVFRLVVIERHGSDWRAVLRDGRLDVLEPRRVPSFVRQIGNNTDYIIHPEEILAENFVHVILNTKRLATPRIVEEMRHVLTARR